MDRQADGASLPYGARLCTPHGGAAKDKLLEAGRRRNLAYEPVPPSTTGMVRAST